MGLETSRYNRTYENDENGDPTLHETLIDALTYSDGTNFDVENRESYLGANLLRGPCFGLASSDGYVMRDYTCSQELGSICLWLRKCILSW